LFVEHHVTSRLIVMSGSDSELKGGDGDMHGEKPQVFPVAPLGFMPQLILSTVTAHFQLALG
jgi:hypothetical protein